MEVKCEHCGDPIDAKTLTHWKPPSYGHNGLCCDCMDLSCGMDLDQLNYERLAKGRAPITKPWPGRDAAGNKITT